MSGNLKDILSHLNPDIDQETLMRYLEGKLTAEQQHDLEKNMLDNDFNTDALEGLQDFRNKQEISLLVEQLNNDLRKRTDRKKRSREKRELKLEPWLIITLVIILLIVVISYVVLHQQLNGK